MNKLKVSIAMAAYNGEKYISEQIESILPQLKESDELIISINPSSDRTEEIARTYQDKDIRIKITICKKTGVLANFENAIKQCKNDIIFLSDQDDIWAKDKVEKQLTQFNDPLVGGVCHGCKYIDAHGCFTERQPEYRKDREIKIREILLKNPVQGSTLAFRKEYTKYFLPFPSDIPMHDSWIALWICRKSKLMYVSEQLLLYRQHEGTVTVRKHKELKDMINDRVKLLYRFLPLKIHTISML